MQYYIYSLVCFLLPGTVWLIWNKGMIADKAYKVRHIIWIYIYLFYGYLAVQEAAGIGTIWDLIAYGKLDNSINLIPFSSEGAMTYILNIIMFMPLGFLLPLLWKEYQSLVRTAIIGFCFSCGIEFCQLFNRRVSDVDDLLMNTLGAILGWLIWIVFSRITHLKYGRRNQGFGGKEGAVYLALSLVGQFFLYNWRWMI